MRHLGGVALPLLVALLVQPIAGLRVNEDGAPRKRSGGPHRLRCKGKSKHSTAVIGGTIVNDTSEFPWLAWIGDNDGTGTGQFCGGALLTDRVVLTAGHCLYNDDEKNANVYVRFNITDFSEMTGIARSVVNWERHPDFNGRILINDVTLLLLNESVANITPLVLSNGTRSYEEYGDKTVAGWGSVDEACFNYDTQLRKAQIPMGTPGPSCQSKGSKTLTKRLDYHVESEVCAGNYNPNPKYPGCGDSGGPLVAWDEEERHHVQVGMVSWSYGYPWPDVFTRVSYFREWIYEHAANLTERGARYKEDKNKTEELKIEKEDKDKRTEATETREEKKRKQH